MGNGVKKMGKKWVNRPKPSMTTCYQGQLQQGFIDRIMRLMTKVSGFKIRCLRAWRFKSAHRYQI
ncbi:hypothetical protein GCM10007931_19720 [Vibrio algivorus]|uniref:Uncharacterized protein n=1 Tax=Vibrio algivorus TaxID=1667024 RepID=A0ABQ6EQY8_9VIBR|nr:hypothetical protein GCM10007931_19720 [Vibrio algivorus]